jgi:hypothetical protein
MESCTSRGFDNKLLAVYKWPDQTYDFPELLSGILLDVRSFQAFSIYQSSNFPGETGLPAIT